ncbi:hypothetical protein DFH09DRAFT_1103718 [Mycena vulgaris]|nr:hypothetical protein DFH09DRAFT_1103718 [Mycena vulgaris]
MKLFLKLATYMVLVLMTSVAADVDLCCVEAIGTKENILDYIGYTGPTPRDLSIGCTALGSSCGLLALTCEEAYLFDAIGVNCKPKGRPVSSGVNLCCTEVVGANEGVGETTLDDIGYTGPLPFDVAIGCVTDNPWSGITQSPNFWVDNLGFEVWGERPRSSVITADLSYLRCPSFATKSTYSQSLGYLQSPKWNSSVCQPRFLRDTDGYSAHGHWSASGYLAVMSVPLQNVGLMDTSYFTHLRK